MLHGNESMKIEKLPRLRVDQELQNICREISRMNKTAEEWSEVESSDMFQSQQYCGGYTSEEQTFWFSYYDAAQKEWWFELQIDQLTPIIEGRLLYLNLIEPV